MENIKCLLVDGVKKEDSDYLAIKQETVIKLENEELEYNYELPDINVDPFLNCEEANDKNYVKLENECSSVEKETGSNENAGSKPQKEFGAVSHINFPVVNKIEDELILEDVVEYNEEEEKEEAAAGERGEQEEESDNISGEHRQSENVSVVKDDPDSSEVEIKKNDRRINKSVKEILFDYKIQETDNGCKVFCCQHCQYRTRKSQNMKKHQLTHTNEKPHKCTICSYSCRQAYQLKKHMMNHNETKPYKCSVCPFSSLYRDSVKKHMMIHTRANPNKCTMCSYFSTTANVKKHMRTHHNQDLTV